MRERVACVAVIWVRGIRAPTPRKGLDEFLERDQDRALFDLPPRVLATCPVHPHNKGFRLRAVSLC